MCPHPRPKVWKLECGDLPHLIMKVFAQSQDRLLPLDPDPHVRPAETQLDHPQIMNQKPPREKPIRKSLA